ncbi:GNAT family N-acetyltransferase [Plantactinospora sp. KBS50]|uniref:GNAT family N-acetyltransferase n=1 Tax=Plantactinospora sp. KBS50 TaxID=2024580 RepID=UPI000BAB1194|nr:GNAT family N-acetyltransferase [Plantactinospora sp. KBS50]ASW56940.1 GNAT family N-acetyltransferase [Plantactinospora sp. KBS50]
MHEQPSWPAGYTGRAATHEDVPAIHRLVAECERALYGRVETDPDVIAAELARPGLDPARDTMLGYGPSGELAARAWVNRRSAVDVHPDHRGRGLGGALLDWTERCARHSGTPRLVQTVPGADQAANALIRSRGFAPKVTAWLLAIELAEEPQLPEPPAGITVRPFAPGDGVAVHHMVEDAFDEWQQRRKPYGEWVRLTIDRARFVPAMSPVAFAGDELVGAVLSLDDPAAGMGYVERVAVRRDHRDRGIARLLLRYAFRGFHQAGRRGCTLWTHSDTRALGLYERVGMSVRRSSTVYQKELSAL